MPTRSSVKGGFSAATKVPTYENAGMRKRGTAGRPDQQTRQYDALVEAAGKQRLPFTDAAYPNPQADVAQNDRFNRLMDVTNAGSKVLTQTAQNTVRNAATGGGTGGGGGFSTASSGRTEPGQGDKWDGFAGRYVPGERDLLFSNPGIIVQDWLENGPYKNNPQLAGDLMRYADIVFGNGNQPGLYELMLGGSLGKAGANVADDKQINYLAELLNQQSQVGGRSPSVQGMVKMLYEMMDNPDSGLNLDLGADGTDPAGTQETISKILQFIPLLGEFTGNQRFSRLLSQDAQNIGQQYLRQQANGQADGSFQDFFRQNFLR